MVLASGLLTIHLLQKLHQSVFVHVYSSSTQGPLDFLAPYLYAGGVSLTLLAQAPPLQGATGEFRSWFHVPHIAKCALNYVPWGCIL